MNKRKIIFALLTAAMILLGMCMPAYAVTVSPGEDFYYIP